MARPRTDPSTPSTTERLLRAAEKAFGRNGFIGARLEDIAHSVGITRPSLLYHFGSKDELYAQVVRRAFALLRGVLEGAVSAGGTFTELIDRLVTSYNAFLDSHPDLALVLLHEVTQAHGKRTRLLLRELVPLLDWMETVVEREGRGVMRAGLPVRAAILQVTTASMVQRTSGPVRRAVWGGSDHTLELARILFVGDQPDAIRAR